jgi:hypothetical protein
LAALGILLVQARRRGGIVESAHEPGENRRHVAPRGE